MPNWCENSLYISGELNELEDFYLENRNYEDEDEDENENEYQELDFYKSVPIPEGEDWYSWNIGNLGTKWNVRDSLYNKYENENKISYEFLTAWCPPINWLTTTSIKYPNLIFKMEYEEESMGFAGVIEVQDVNIIKYESWDPHERYVEEGYEENKEEIDSLLVNHYNLKMINYIELNESERNNLIDDLMDELYEKGHPLTYKIVDNLLKDRYG